MQIAKKDFNEAFHEKWRALSVSLETAVELTTPVIQNAKGDWLAVVTTLEFAFGTKYKGDILICSPYHTRGLVELYDVTFIRRGVYHWHFRNPRKVVEYPVEGKRKGLWTYICPKDEVTPYPRKVILEEEGFKDLMSGGKKTRGRR